MCLCMSVSVFVHARMCEFRGSYLWRGTCLLDIAGQEQSLQAVVMELVMDLVWLSAQLWLHRHDFCACQLVKKP